MRFQRVLLVSPPTSSYLGAARPPQNLGYLARALLDRGIAYDILDMRLGYQIKHLESKIRSFDPDLIGVSVVSLEYRRTYALLEWIRKTFPDVKLVCGGPHLTVIQERVLEECEVIDFGVVHEGEQTLVELCESEIPIEEIKGLIHRQGAEIMYNGHRSYPRNLDEIAFPTYEGFELHRYIPEMPFNSSRGCPLRCVFCPNKMITKKFRWRSAAHVVDEIEYWYDRGIRIFNYDDDNFTYFNDRVYEICDEIERRKICDVELRCSNGIRADRVDEPLLRRMKEVGFNYIAFGVDGGNDRMLRINKKGETLEQIENAISLACEIGFDVKIFCVVGMPYETEADIQDSFRLVRRYPVKRVILNNPIPYPGTELYDTVLANGWFLKPPETYLNDVTENVDTPVFETPELPLAKRIEILKICRKIEKQVTRRAVERMYNHFYFGKKIIGLVFASSFMQKQFFMNMHYRRFVERIRYRRALAKTRLETTGTG